MNRYVKFSAIAAAVAICTTSLALGQEKVRLTGSGASFPAPIYLTWFKDFSKKNPNLTVDYQSKGRDRKSTRLNSSH